MLVNGVLLVRSGAEARSPRARTVAFLVFLAALALFTGGWHRTAEILSILRMLA
ncbi:hypothetical protein [Cupriavidus oxalaticus]